MSERKSFFSDTDKQSFKLFWRAGLLQPKRLLFRMLLHPVGTISLGSIAPFFIGKILATLGQHHVSAKPYVIGFFVTAIIGLLGNRFGFTAFLEYQAKTMRNLQAQGMEALLKRSVGFHNNNIGGKLVSDASDFPGGFGMFVNAVVTQLMPFTTTILAGTIIVFTQSWKLGLVILLMSSLIIGDGLIDSRRRSELRKERLAATKKLTGHLADTILNVQTVKTFANEATEFTKHKELSGVLLNLRLRDWTRAAMNGNKRMTILVVMQAVFVVTAVNLVHNNPALLGVGIFAFGFTITLTNRLFDINTMIRQIEDGLLLASPMTEILMEKTEIVDQPGAKALQVTKGGITFSDVDFHYHDGSTDQAVFKDLNITVKPGEKIGLVGPSGGGKSTLTRLVLRFEDLDSGTITIDGQNIAEVTQHSLRQAISYVPQEPLLFHRPIAENIGYGNPNVKTAAIAKAAKAAHAHDFISELPNGYDTIVGERGVKLSGGQRQRVAIARAILKDAPILILDEATSALDSESEVLIQDALWKLMEKRTAIVIAHRLSTIQKMDRIIVLDQGAIVEEGTHKQLLAKKGTYARLWTHQSGGFLDDSETE